MLIEFNDPATWLAAIPARTNAMHHAQMVMRHPPINARQLAKHTSEVAAIPLSRDRP